MKNFTCTILFMFSFAATLSADTCIWFGGTDLWSDDTKWSCGHVPGPGDIVIISGGSVEIDIPAHAGTLKLTGGTIIGDGVDKLFTGAFLWEGGTVGPGAVIDILAGGGCDIEMEAIKTLDGEINNFGTCTWKAGTLFFDGAFNNFGEFIIDFDGALSGSGTFMNDGIFHKTMGAGTASLSFGEVTNTMSGAINAASGTIDLFGTSISNSGDLKAEFGHTLRIECDMMVLAAGSSLPGEGTLKIVDGDIGLTEPIETDLTLELSPATFAVDGELIANAPVEILEGEFSGTAKMVFKSTLDWESGLLDVPIDIEASGALNLKTTGDKLLRRLLTLKSIADWTAGKFSISTATGGLKIEAGGTFNMKTDGPLEHEVGFAKGMIENDGTFNLDNSSDGEVAIPFNNDLNLNVVDGILSLTDGLDHEGILTISTGKELQLFGTSDFKASSSIAGFGLLDFQAGAATINQEYDTSVAIDISGGILTLNEDLITDGEVLIKGGTLDGTGTFYCDGSTKWEGGTIDAPVEIHPSSTFTIRTGSTKTLKNELTVKGTSEWNGGEIMIESPGVFENIGTFNANGTNSQEFDHSTSTGTFKNTGTFINKNTTNNIEIDIDFENTGTLRGVGIYDFDETLTNTGRVSPGLSPGYMQMLNDYSNGSELTIELSNAGQDRLQVFHADLSGKLKVYETGPLDNGTYTILSCTGRSGVFSNVELPNSYYSISYGPTYVRIHKSTVLPVEMLNFEVIENNNKVELNWETASEENNDYFVIERSTDGASFKAIGQAAGSGSSNAIVAYQFIDQAAYQMNTDRLYYRLRQVDFDGQSSYSEIKILELTIRGNALEIENIYQPNINTLSVQIYTHEAQEVYFQIYGLDGKLMRSKKVLLQRGSQNFEFSNLQLNRGVYVLSGKLGRGFISKRFFVQY